MKTILILIATYLSLSITTAWASPQGATDVTELEEMMLQAYLSNDTELWKQAVGQLETLHSTEPNNSDVQLTLARAYYGLLGSSLSSEDEELFDAYRDKAVDLLELLREQEGHAAKAQALLAGVYGVEMGFSPWKGMMLGMKSGKLIEGALDTNPEEPMAWKEKAGSKLFTPAMFGGNKKKALEFYSKAVSLYEGSGAALQTNWNYLETLAWLGIAQQENEQFEEAIATYEKVLSMQESFGWVAYVLKPAAERGEKVL